MQATPLFTETPLPMTPPLPHDPIEQLIANFQHALTALANNQLRPIGFVTLHPTTNTLDIGFFLECSPDEFRANLSDIIHHTIRQQLLPIALLFLTRDEVVSTWIYAPSLVHTPLTGNHIALMLTEMLTTHQHNQPPLFRTPRTTICLN